MSGGYGFLRLSLPQVQGELKLVGLKAPVSVYRDTWGVPHIEAQSSADLYMAQGFVTAQDRLWGMDMSRRAASGRLSEILGESYISTDRYFRALLLRHSAEISVQAYSPWAREMLEAYTAGVNAYIKQATAFGKLPIEFSILGYKPEPWSPVDSAAVGKYMAYDLGGNLAGEIYRYQLRKTLGDTLAVQLWPTYPKDGITIIKSAQAESGTKTALELPPDNSHIDLSGLLAAAIFPDQWNGSNNWVVGGQLTASGKPLLANDPHLGLRTPAIWYQTNLVLNGPQEKQNVIGVTFPGAPGIVLGHTDKIAWGVTNTGPDVQDLYIERRNPTNPYQFEYQGKWEDAVVYKDPIKVKGKPDVANEVVVTRHGPIVSEVVGGDKGHPTDALALKWTAHLPTTELEGVLNFGRAANWSEFREALRHFQVPTQNFVFASVDGTIAYHAAGIVPIRAKGDGLVPVPGWTGTYEWKEYIPFEKMPEVINPADGFIATANNKVVPENYPYFLSTSWAQPYRAMRITEVLKSKTGLTADDMQKLQTDFTNIQARTLLPILLPLVEKATLTTTEQGAYATLKGWDFIDAADKAAPLAYQLWWRNLTKQLYLPQMGPDLYKLMEDKGTVTDEAIKQASHGNPNDWMKAAGGLDKLAVDSFKSAVTEAVSLQGKDPLKWTWGAYHQIGPEHPLGGAVKELGWFLNPKLTPIGGSALTVAAMSFNRGTGYVTNSAPWRQVVDLADITHNSRDVVTPGESGNFMSPWYKDQFILHVNGKLHPQEMNAEAYKKGLLLTLKP
jgi:penicillin amidase